MAYQATGREEECISLYKSLEDTHPIPAIRRQAADLRYIMEAPKLEISEDEKIKLPLLEDVEKNANRGLSVPKPKPRIQRRKEVRHGSLNSRAPQPRV